MVNDYDTRTYTWVQSHIYIIPNKHTDIHQHGGMPIRHVIVTHCFALDALLRSCLRWLSHEIVHCTNDSTDLTFNLTLVDSIRRSMLN